DLADAESDVASIGDLEDAARNGETHKRTSAARAAISWRLNSPTEVVAALTLGGDRRCQRTLRSAQPPEKTVPLRHYYLSQCDSAVVRGYLAMRVHHKPKRFECRSGALCQISVLKNSAAEHDLMERDLSGNRDNPVDQCVVKPGSDMRNRHRFF